MKQHQHQAGGRVNTTTTERPFSPRIDRNYSKPKLTLPPGACDCHFHFIGPQKQFTLKPNHVFSHLEFEDTPIEDWLTMQDALGLQRGSACALDDVRAQLRDRAACPEPAGRSHPLGDRAMAAYHRRRTRHPHQGRRGRLSYHLAAHQDDRPENGGAHHRARLVDALSAPRRRTRDGCLEAAHPEDAGQFRAGAHGRRRSRRRGSTERASSSCWPASTPDAAG